MKHCNGCGEDKELSEFNFVKSGVRMGKPLSRCRKCRNIIKTAWRNNNLEKVRKCGRESWYKKGRKSAIENKSCTAYLGVVVAETILSHEFPGFVRMPYGNPDYDYECPRGFKIDVKSGCKLHKKNGTPLWAFNIRKNKKANYFLCIAFGYRNEPLMPEHIWLIPGNMINDKIGIGITDSLEGLAKWSKFERPLENVLGCCDKLRDD